MKVKIINKDSVDYIKVILTKISLKNSIYFLKLTQNWILFYKNQCNTPSVS